MKYTPIVTPELLAPYAHYLSESAPAPLPALVPRDSASFRLDLRTPDGVQASIAVDGAPAWVWFLAGAGTAAIVFVASSQQWRRGRR